MSTKEFKDEVNTTFSEFSKFDSPKEFTAYSSQDSNDAKPKKSRNIFQRCIDSFKPPEDGSFDTSNLKRTLKSRHLIMIAIGGSIGTGLFIGSGQALATGGPLAVIIGWSIAGSQIVGTIHGLGEITVRFPVVGAFADYSTRFLDPSISFVVSTIYVIQWFFVLPLEIIASAITIQYWNSSIDPVVWVAIFYAAIVSINLFGARGFGEAEFVFSTIKAITVCGFIILCIVLICGGGPDHDYVGAKFWHNPGALANGFPGVLSVLVVASYSLGGTEMTCLASGETDPKELPSAIKQVFWRILFFFLASLTLVGFLVPYTNENLLGGSSVDNSPFVIAIKLHHIKALPSIVNAVILISIMSVGNSCIFASSRTLCSMAHQGLIPWWFGYIDRAGRPLAGIITNSLFGLLAFLVKSSSVSEVFDWLMAIAGLATCIVWLSINVSHIRFRMAMRAQGKKLDELEFVSAVGVWGSAYSALINFLILIAQFYISLWPIGGWTDSSQRAKKFFQSYLCALIMLLIFVIHKIYYKVKFGRWWDMKPLKEIDLETGRKNVDIDVIKAEIAEKKMYLDKQPWIVRWYHFWC
ncbi:aromatic amino acid transmembrane transporter TAT2 [Nakaseomyces bracarensis]|uniref:aromatic amino acid transmembrane transporter TAT2 n=1 Tax=Nakaseomyces bracarensis TaxID=273131 RepID=UPI003871A833